MRRPMRGAGIARPHDGTETVTNQTPQALEARHRLQGKNGPDNGLTLQYGQLGCYEMRRAIDDNIEPSWPPSPIWAELSQLITM